MKTAIRTTLIGALAAAACATGGATSDPGPPENAVWTETVEIRLDEVFLTPDRGLEVSPVRIGVDSATLDVRVEGLTRDLDLQATGPLASETVPPYHIRLLRTSAEPTVTVRISKLPD